MYTKIKEFHSLCLPHLDGARAGEWCTYSEQDGLLYLLNGNRYEIASIDDNDIDIDDDIHFVTEADCHAAMAEYYLRYNVTYPYLKEWREALKLTQGVVIGDGSVQSQVMEF